MRLGNYESLKAALTEVFGEEVYTDDNEVVLFSDEESETVASLWPTENEGELWIKFTDGRPNAVIKVPGAGLEPHENIDFYIEEARAKLKLTPLGGLLQ